MTTKAMRSTRPYYLTPCLEGGFDFDLVDDASGNMVARIIGRDVAGKIVAALNAHDDLVAALNKMVIAVDAGVSVTQGHRCYGEARAALAKAGVT